MGASWLVNGGAGVPAAGSFLIASFALITGCGGLAAGGANAAVSGIASYCGGSAATAASCFGPATDGSTAGGPACAVAPGGASFTVAQPAAATRQKIPTIRTMGIILLGAGIERGAAHLPPCRNRFIQRTLAFRLRANCFALSPPRRLNQRVRPRLGAGVAFAAGLGAASAAALGSVSVEIVDMNRLLFYAHKLSAGHGAVCSVAN